MAAGTGDEVGLVGVFFDDGGERLLSLGLLAELEVGFAEPEPGAGGDGAVGLGLLDHLAVEVDGAAEVALGFLGVDRAFEHDGGGLGAGGERRQQREDEDRKQAGSHGRCLQSSVGRVEAGSMVAQYCYRIFTGLSNFVPGGGEDGRFEPQRR